MKVLQNTARLIISPKAPYAEIRTSGCIIVAASYIIARQLAESGKLDSFGLSIVNLGLASCMVFSMEFQKLLLQESEPRLDNSDHTENTENTDTSIPATIRQTPPLPQANQFKKNLNTALRNISSALSLAGSSGLLTNWILKRQEGYTEGASIKSLIVPATFANSAIFKLLANSDAIPEQALPYAKCIALTGMLVGSALFTELALTERDDIPLFTVSSILSAGLLPQTLMAIRDIFRVRS